MCSNLLLSNNSSTQQDMHDGITIVFWCGFVVGNEYVVSDCSKATVLLLTKDHPVFATVLFVLILLSNPSSLSSSPSTLNSPTTKTHGKSQAKSVSSARSVQFPCRAVTSSPSGSTSSIGVRNAWSYWLLVGKGCDSVKRSILPPDLKMKARRIRFVFRSKRATNEFTAFWIVWILQNRAD